MNLGTVGGCRHKPQRRVGRGRAGHSSRRSCKESFLLWAVCEKVEKRSVWFVQNGTETEGLPGQ